MKLLATLCLMSAGIERRTGPEEAGSCCVSLLTVETVRWFLPNMNFWRRSALLQLPGGRLHQD